MVLKDDVPIRQARNESDSRRRCHQLQSRTLAVQNAGSTAYGFPRTMALRRRDVIIATIIAFISWGFVTHWVPTLRYLPYAFIAGGASTVAILGWLIISTSRGKQYQERSGGGYGARHVAFVTPETWRMETEALKRRSQYKREPLYPASFVI